jgi:phosphoglycerate dehydrogenase-like enzyme
VPLDELLRTSDVVTLHVFLAESSRQLIGERVNLMKPQAVLVNTSRGDVVDEAALCRVLERGQLYGAGIDAWTIEPTPPDNPLLRFENVLVTPHMATANKDAMIKKSQATYANFQRILHWRTAAECRPPLPRSGGGRGRWRVMRGMVRLDGKTSLVVDASSRLGRAIALELAAAGAHVVVADVDHHAGADIVAQIERLDASASQVLLDPGGSGELRCGDTGRTRPLWTIGRAVRGRGGPARATQAAA